jgi:hypothetical protein
MPQKIESPLLTAADFRHGMRVWWRDPNRDPQLGDRAARVLSVNQQNDTVLVEFYKDPTAEREETAEVVSPRTLRAREGK